MNKIILSAAIAVSAALGAGAQNYGEYGISGIDVQRPTDATLRVVMTINPKDCHSLSYRESATVTPIIKGTADGIEQRLPSFTLAGRNAYYYDLRGDDAPNIYRAGKDDVVRYSHDIEYQPWMEKSKLMFEITEGCCGKYNTVTPVLATLDYGVPQFNPAYEYIQPAAVASKLFNLEGTAFINFIVNKTIIDPDYMTNSTELKKILDTIDAVRDNKDAKVKKIKLTGYASPEGPYENNVRLAKGRTDALREYVREQYAFPESLFETNSVPEDWQGLREAVSKSELADAKEIVEFIDSDYPIEKRNDRLRQLFPQTYPYLLKYIYPGLRHTDYVVNYEVRKYTDVNEIREVLKTHPQNLSLNEFFLAAQSYKPGSPEYNNVFDVAVRMYPKDPVANINAAIAAMNRNDLSQAEQFLKNAGNSADADYARGLLAAKKGDYDRAVQILKTCPNPKAKDALEQIYKIQNYKGAIQWTPITK